MDPHYGPPSLGTMPVEILERIAFNVKKPSQLMLLSQTFAKSINNSAFRARWITENSSMLISLIFHSRGLDPVAQNAVKSTFAALFKYIPFLVKTPENIILDMLRAFPDCTPISDYKHGIDSRKLLTIVTCGTRAERLTAASHKVELMPFWTSIYPILPVFDRSIEDASELIAVAQLFPTGFSLEKFNFRNGEVLNHIITQMSDWVNSHRVGVRWIENSLKIHPNANNEHLVTIARRSRVYNETIAKSFEGVSQLEQLTLLKDLMKTTDGRNHLRSNLANFLKNAEMIALEYVLDQIQQRNQDFLNTFDRLNYHVSLFLIYPISYLNNDLAKNNILKLLGDTKMNSYDPPPQIGNLISDSTRTADLRAFVESIIDIMIERGEVEWVVMQTRLFGHNMIIRPGLLERLLELQNSFVV